MKARKTVVRIAVIVVVATSMLAAAQHSSSVKVQRYGMVIGVKPDKLDYYKKLHAHPWPAINKMLKQCHIRNYSIYLTQFDDGQWYLFSYFEYTGDDFDADMKKMAADPDTQRWWKETDPCQVALKNRKAGQWWKTMDEVYHLD